MQVATLVQELGLHVHTGEQQLCRDVTGGCTSDLLSYVMGTARPGNVWITIQVHPNIVGVAALLDLAAVVVADGQQPEEATLEKAREQGVTVLTSTESAFTVAGRLYALGVR
jgi:predicted transcriptional regulator